MFIQYVWPCVIGFFHLTNYFQGPSCCSMYQYIISFYGRIVYYTAILHFVYPSISDGHLLRFQFGAIMNNPDENICVQVFVLTNLSNVNPPHKTLKEKSYHYNKIINNLFYNNFGFFKSQPFSHPITQRLIRKTGIITESKSKTESEEVRCSLRSLVTLSQQNTTTNYFSVNRREKKDQDIL